MSIKVKITGAIIVAILLGLVFVYFRYFFTFEQKNIIQKKIDTVTGQNLTVTVFGMDGKIIKRWMNVKKITSGSGERNFSYTYFYTHENKFVQIPNSVWYIAEEE